MKRIVGTVGIIWGLSCGVADAASSAPLGVPALPEGYADAYRLETQYGADHAVLNPAFDRDGKLEISLGGAYSAQSSLMNYSSATAAMTYHFSLRHSFEPIWFGYAWGRQGTFVKDEITARITPSLEPLRSTVGVEVPEQMFASSYFFSPYYSKMHITERSVAHFDTYMGVGVGVLRSRTLYLNGQKGGLTNRPALSLAAGIRFLFPSRWGLRFEIRDFMHSVNNFGKSAAGNTLQIGASADIFFGAFRDSSKD